MGGWERNVVIFGATGVLSIAGILLGGVVAGMIWTFFVLAVAMFLALGRFGPDRVTLEEWLLRRWRYSRSVRRYTYIQPGQPPGASVPARPAAPQKPEIAPVTFAEDRGAYYGAVSVLMAVAGLVFVLWLRGGGDAELARTFQSFIGR